MVRRPSPSLRLLASAALLALSLGALPARPEPNPFKTYGLWAVVENRDKMTDAVAYGLLYSDPANAVLLVPDFAGQKGVHHLTAVGHDYPGKTMRARVDKNPPHDLGEGAANAAKLVEEMLAGKLLVVEYYHWPDDNARYAECALDDFPQAWRDFMAPPGGQ